jgi:hypothetical protein
LMCRIPEGPPVQHEVLAQLSDLPGEIFLTCSCCKRMNTEAWTYFGKTTYTVTVG